MLSNIRFEVQTRDGKFITKDVLGANLLGQAFVANHSTGRYQIQYKGRALPDSGTGSTYNDYVKLAYGLGGYAFDIQKLRDTLTSKGLTKALVTKALVNISAEGIEEQFVSRCEELSCKNGRWSTVELKELAVRDLCVSGKRSWHSQFWHAVRRMPNVKWKILKLS